MAKTRQERARDAYVADVRGRVAKASGHVRALRKGAPGRIAKAAAHLKAAGAGDDLDSHDHAVGRMLYEVAFYPPHDKRTESSAYKTVHEKLVKAQDRPCLACGVRFSTLGDEAANPFGAVQMETHHHIIEWALANGIDPAKFNTRILPGLLHRDRGKYSVLRNGMTKAQILDWVDHDEDNLWVLCDVHHRHKFVGIHAITYPIWAPQDIVDANLRRDESKQARAGHQRDVAS